MMMKSKKVWNGGKKRDELLIVFIKRKENKRIEKRILLVYYSADFETLREKARVSFTIIKSY